ncbi:MAG: MarC family protein [Petrotogales bacterium]
MIRAVIEFLVLLSPFALFLYLRPVMKELVHRDFVKVLIKAHLISFVIFFVFLASGNFIFRQILNINFESFRIFGGIIIFSIAYIFIMKGQKAFFQLKGSLDDLAAEIALPFLVGAATISLTILLGEEFSVTIGTLLLVLILSINFLSILFLKYLRDRIKKKKLKIAFDKNIEVLLRLNGFFIGAIGINMIIRGINTLYPR